MTVEPAFDEIIHAPNRLRICAALAPVTEAEFATLRELLGVSDPVVSKHLRVLHNAGYVTISKPTGGPGRVRTWVGLTRAGRRAYEAHIAELRRLTGAGLEAAGQTGPPSTSSAGARG